MKKLFISLTLILCVVSFSYAGFHGDSYSVISRNGESVGYSTPSSKQKYKFGTDYYAKFTLKADAYTNGTTGCQALAIASIYNDGATNDAMTAKADGYGSPQEVRVFKYYTGYADYLYIMVSLSAYNACSSGNASISW